jgi:hypothetical protein
MESREIINWLFRFGYFDSPEALSYGRIVEADLPKLALRNPVVKAALREAQDFNGVVMEAYSFEEHGRSSIHDGITGPATERMMVTPRCGEKDFQPPAGEAGQNVQAAVGNGGNWARCHGIGNFHAANCNVTNRAPAHVWPHFGEIQRRVTRAYQEIGLQWYWTGPGSVIQDGKSGIQVDASWVDRSSGWIGLAQVVSNASCSSRIWCRYLSTYLRNTTNPETIIRMMAVLWMHELYHNCGGQHTRGGIGNPSILSLPATWKGDPAESWLKARYGGEPIPTTPTGPGPEPKPNDLFFRGEVELMEGSTSRGKYMLVPVPRVI